MANAITDPNHVHTRSCYEVPCVSGESVVVELAKHVLENVVGNDYYVSSLEPFKSKKGNVCQWRVHYQPTNGDCSEVNAKKHFKSITKSYPLNAFLLNKEFRLLEPNAYVVTYGKRCDCKNPNFSSADEVSH